MTVRGMFVQLKSSHAVDANGVRLQAQAPEFTPTKSGISKSARTPSKTPLDFSEEVNQAALWWSTKMRQHDLAVSEVQAFETGVRNGLLNRCNGHWYPSDPLRGSGHRSLVNDFSTDPVFLSAAAAVNIRDIAGRLPRAVMWVNPSSVKVQLENGRYPDTVFSSTSGSSSDSHSEASEEDDH
jgi:hypothetical protein